MKDATAALLRAIRLAMPGGTAVAFEDIQSRSWASATFTGTRHSLALHLEGDGAEEAANAFADGLEEREFALRGHILADIALLSRTCSEGPTGPRVRLSLEALTVEEG